MKNRKDEFISFAEIGVICNMHHWLREDGHPRMVQFLPSERVAFNPTPIVGLDLFMVRINPFNSFELWYKYLL